MNRLWNRLLSAVEPSFGSDQHGRRLAFHQIAQALGAATDAEVTTERSNILKAVGDRVGSADAATAATAMTELSRLLHAITDRNF